MFVRIVKLSFHPENIETFVTHFHTVKDQIRHFKGNTFLELYQDKNNPSIFFTYSIWEEESDLEEYRTSALFTEVWAHTKVLFNAKPEAWSVDKLATLP